jgi:SAM-dependent methyltransferase
MTEPDVGDFYDRLAPFYHLIFADWEASIQRQAEALHGLIREAWGTDARRILDVACGIGTQALGLAGRGYAVTAADLSAGAVKRAQREAQQRRLDIAVHVTDMRRADKIPGGPFDVAIACDNSVPHLLTDEDTLAAFTAMWQSLRPGGGVLLTVRDYDAEQRGGVQLKPYGVRDEGGRRYVLFQVWEFHGEVYDLGLYLVEDAGGPECTTRVMRSRYRAVGTGPLLALLEKAGFREVRRVDGRYYQPVLLGTR